MSFLEKCKNDGLISHEAYQKLNSFADLILQWNPRINLTGMRSRQQIEENLFGDCILALPHLHPGGKNVLDFGSGAGIPGLVWLMVVPSIRLTSLEIRAKKVAFQKEVARKLGLKAEILCGQFPETVRERRFDVIVTRAIRFDPKLWSQAESLLREGGCFVRFAGINTPEDGWQSRALSETSAVLTFHVKR
jgi:16S rRNA (guanine527-N7)-methyltransferase